MVRVKLFESFSEEQKIKQDINDMLVELGDNQKFKWTIDFEYSLKVGFTRYWDENDIDRDYDSEDFFMLSEISEYVYMVVDYMKLNKLHNRYNLMYPKPKLLNFKL